MATLSIPKFIGTISLGLLTGISYTLSTLSYPSLLSLPSASLAHSTRATLATSSTTQIRILASISTFALTSAYLLSPRNLKHPYLLWTALLSLGTVGSDIIDAVQRLLGSGQQGQGQARAEEEEFNGETVERDVRALQKRERARTVVAGLGFMVGVIGLWGDGAVPVVYAVRR